MIVLPEGAFTVVPEKAEEKTKSGIIIPNEEIKDSDIGIITYVGRELVDKKGLKIRFRRSFGEELEIDGVKHIYFRDFNSSIYYVIKD